jgi:hypothetical protein
MIRSTSDKADTTDKTPFSRPPHPVLSVVSALSEGAAL